MWIQTYEGHRFWPLTAEGVLSFEDMVHATAHQCRFNGHTSEFYSVAQHGVFVSQILEERLGYSDPKLLMTGLLHDAAEAYISDIPAPIKSELIELLEAEHAVEQRLAREYRLYDPPWPGAVKEADKIAVVTEAKHLLKPPAPDDWGLIQEPWMEYPFCTWSPETSKYLFVERYRELNRRRANEEKYGA